ncbi:MAG: hypothetical protein ACFFC7_29575 [Candidatus Hermodarchaeota archaeon]
MMRFYFIVSMLFLAPLIAITGGVFYALDLMSAIERGLVTFWHSPILIVIKISLVLLTITFGSVIRADIFEVLPEKAAIVGFWETNWKRLVPEQKKKWREVLRENRKEIIIFSIIIIEMLIFGAWFEVWGY